MSKARRGRDNRALPTVDVSSEYAEVERRRYHAELRRERAVQETRTKSAGSARSAVEQALEEAAPRLERQGWRITRKEQ